MPWFSHKIPNLDKAIEELPVNIHAGQAIIYDNLAALEEFTEHVNQRFLFAKKAYENYLKAAAQKCDANDAKSAIAMVQKAKE